MAPLIFALVLLAQDAAAPEPAPAPTPAAVETPDGPMATAVPRKQDVVPLPIQGGPVSAPSDDYGYVGWCYGAIAGYVDLYETAMPEVIRIERAWPTPSTEENINEVYPEQRSEAEANLKLFRRAMQAAEKASPTPIQIQGTAAIKRGRAVWTGARSVPKAQLAQFWMSWSPPSKCEETAKALETRSLLFGQALTYNTKPAAAPAAPPPAPEPQAALAESEAPVEAADVAATTAPGIEAPAADVPVADVPVGETAVAEAPGSIIETLLPEGEPAAAPSEQTADQPATTEKGQDEASPPPPTPSPAPSSSPPATETPPEGEPLLRGPQ